MTTEPVTAAAEGRAKDPGVVVLEIRHIAELIPHRGQWLFINTARIPNDAVVPTIFAGWQVSPRRIEGHVPAIMPAVLWPEIGNQAAATLLGYRKQHRFEGMMTEIRSAKFHRPVPPGSEVWVEVTINEESRLRALFQVTGWVNGQVAFESIQVGVIDRDQYRASRRNGNGNGASA